MRSQRENRFKPVHYFEGGVHSHQFTVLRAVYIQTSSLSAKTKPAATALNVQEKIFLFLVRAKRALSKQLQITYHGIEKSNLSQVFEIM